MLFLKVMLLQFMSFAKCAIYLTIIYVVRKEESLPTWERGLKLYLTVEHLPGGRSLPTWERGLKHPVIKNNSITYGRSPRGSVD